MDCYYKKTKIAYKTIGNGNKHVLCLHGWGDSKENWEFFTNKFDFSATYILIDFPPFGNSQEPNDVWQLSDYANLVIEILKILKVKKVDILAHSFGGRVAIYLASHYNNYVDKLVLVSSAGLKPKFSLKIKMKIIACKIKRKLKIKSKDYGSDDYRLLSQVMKETFKNIISKNLKAEAKTIFNETILIFGNRDKSTPLYMGKKLNKYMKGSALITFKNCGHFPHYQNSYTFVNICNSFLGEKKDGIF